MFFEVLRPYESPWLERHVSGSDGLLLSVAGVGALSDGPGLLDVRHLSDAGDRVQNIDESGEIQCPGLDCSEHD